MFIYHNPAVPFPGIKEMNSGPGLTGCVQDATLAGFARDKNEHV